MREPFPGDAAAADSPEWDANVIDAEEPEPWPAWRLLKSLLLMAMVGGPIWVIYAFASGSATIFGNCGGQDFIGQAGHLAGVAPRACGWRR